MSKTFILTLAAALTLGAAAAHAQDADAPRSQHVAYRDLDLSHAAGQQQLQARVHTAAEAVCGPAPTITDLNRHALYGRCVRDAEASVASQVMQVVADATSREDIVIKTAMVEPRR